MRLLRRHHHLQEGHHRSHRLQHFRCFMFVYCCCHHQANPCQASHHHLRLGCCCCWSFRCCLVGGLVHHPCPTNQCHQHPKPFVLLEAFWQFFQVQGSFSSPRMRPSWWDFPSFQILLFYYKDGNKILGIVNVNHLFLQLYIILDIINIYLLIYITYIT